MMCRARLICRLPARDSRWRTCSPEDASIGAVPFHEAKCALVGNRVMHIMAVVQLRNPTEGRAYYDRKVAAGKTPTEAMRALNRRLSDIVYHQMITDSRAPATGPGGHAGGGYWLQRGRLAPLRRHFGEVTSRTRRPRPYARKATPFSWSYPALSIGAGPQATARTGAHYPGRE